ATTGTPSRRAARTRIAAFFSSAANPAAFIAAASFSCTSTMSSSASARSSASVRGSGACAGSNGISLRSAGRRRLRVQHAVDAGDGAGRDRALQRRPDLRRIGDVLAVPAEGFDHLVVPGGCEEGPGALFHTVELD